MCVHTFREKLVLMVLLVSQEVQGSLAVRERGAILGQKDPMDKRCEYLHDCAT